jgi:hypothetical protein
LNCWAGRESGPAEAYTNRNKKAAIDSFTGCSFRLYAAIETQ